MKIEMTEIDLFNISANTVKNVAREIDIYFDRSEESDDEEGVYLIEREHLIDFILSIDIELKTILTPKNS